MNDLLAQIQNVEMKIELKYISGDILLNLHKMVGKL